MKTKTKFNLILVSAFIAVIACLVSMMTGFSFARSSARSTAEVWTRELYEDAAINVPSGQPDAVSFTDAPSCRVTLSPDTTPGDSSGNATIAFNRAYKGDFTLEFTYTYLSAEHTRLRYFLFTVGNAYSFSHVASNAAVYLTEGTNTTSGTSVSMSDDQLNGAVIRFEVKSNKLTMFLNGTQFGTEQDYASAVTTFSITANRVKAEISNVSVTGEAVSAGQIEGEEHVWAQADYENSEISVPQYEGNSLSVADKKIAVSLSAAVGAEDYSYDASARFLNTYTGDFSVRFTYKYLSVSHTQTRWFMFTVGDAYSFLHVPSDPFIYLTRGKSTGDRIASAQKSDAEMAEIQMEITVREGSIYFYINGSQFGTVQPYNVENTQFSIRAHRVAAEVSDVSVTGNLLKEEGEKDVWTKEIFADSEIDVPQYSDNGVTFTDNDEFRLSLSSATDQNSNEYDASVRFARMYEGNFTATFKYTYEVPDDGTYTGTRHFMFTVGDAYSVAHNPYNAQFQLVRGTNIAGGIVSGIAVDDAAARSGVTVKIVVNAGALSIYVNGAVLADAVEYTNEQTGFSVTARRVMAKISDFEVFGTVVQKQEEEIIPVTPSNNASTDEFRFITAAGTTNPTFIINRNLGGNPYTLTEIAADKVVYEKAGGGHKALKEVKYSMRLIGDICPCLSFVFDGAAETGDRIVVKKGFTFKDYNGNELGLQLNGNYVAEFTQNGWQGNYVIMGKEASVSSGTVTVGDFTSAGSILIDFDLAGVAGGASYFDDEASGWHQYDPSNADLRVYNKLSESAIFLRNGERVNTRFALSQGKLAFVNASGTIALQEGDGIILRKGLTIYELNADGYDVNAGYVFGEQNYLPVFILHENLVFGYDGEKFVRAESTADATVTNEEALQALRVGMNAKIEWEIDRNAVDYPKFTSSNTEIATIDGEGNIVALQEGEVTFTLAFTDITKSVTVTIGAAAARTGIAYSLELGAIKGEEKYIVAYVGENPDVDLLVRNISASWILEGDAEGSAFEVTADMISFGKFDNSAAGTSAVTLTHEGFSVDIPVCVYEIKTVEDVLPSRVISWANLIDIWFVDSIGGSEVSDPLTVNIIENPLYGIPADMATLRTAALDGAKAYELHTIGQTSNLQCLLGFNGFDPSDKDSIRVGTVLSLNENFRFYRHIDGTFVAAYKLKSAVAYVWSGTQWQYFEGDTTSVELENRTLELPVGACVLPEYTLTPENSYYRPSFTTTDESVVAVENGKLVAKGAGTAIVCLVYGTRQIEISVTVEDKALGGIRLFNDRVFNISAGEELDLSKIKVCADFGNGLYGEEFALNGDIATYELDSSVAGKVTLEISVLYEGETYTVPVTVAVWGVEEVYPDNISCADDAGWFMGNTIAIYFRKTFSNLANVYPSDLSEADGKLMSEYITYTRDGATVTCEGPAFLTYLFTFTPKENGNEISAYRQGDVITLKEGMSFYKWFGDIDSNNVPVGEGDYVKVGKIAYDITFTYNENNKWYLVIPANDAAVIEETVTVGLGETHATNVKVIPAYATNAEWFFTVGDETIATVNAQGLIKGQKLGSTTVTAVLKTVQGSVIKTLQYKVDVADSVKEIKIIADKEVRVKAGTDFNFAEWKEQYGIKGVIIMSSGAEGEEVDLSEARITGYDPEKEGEQTVTFRVSVNGKSVTGELKVSVYKKSGCGCGSSIDGKALFILSLLTAAFVAGILKKRRAQ